ncbi:MAG: hypothetical protein KDD58_05005 [Bdellovibrionales bacterium]|nr:hypothetical protein [Bdellovibrionales bacterium]
MKFYLLTIILLTSISSWARNPFVDSLNKKVEVKKKTRWTLADWLDTKKQISLMDAWLAANTSANLFEFYVGGSLFNFEDKLVSTPGLMPTNGDSSTYSIAGFVSIFGLVYNRITEGKDVIDQGEFIVRLLGKAEQGTRLNLLYGYNKINSKIYNDSYDLPYIGASLRIYLLSFLAIQSRYVSYIQSKLPNATDIDGSQVEYGLAVDVGPLQLTADVVSQTTEMTGAIENRRDGYKYGIHLFF